MATSILLWRRRRIIRCRIRWGLILWWCGRRYMLEVVLGTGLERELVPEGGLHCHIASPSSWALSCWRVGVMLVRSWLLEAAMLLKVAALCSLTLPN
jgi:hypothetical protein